MFKIRMFVWAACMAVLSGVSISSFAAEKKYAAFEVKVVGKGQPIILIPGATCSGDEWNETVAHLKGKYQCHVLTLAGYAGAPPLPGRPYLETYKNQIEQYITDNKLKNVILIGHSLGGVVAMWVASEMKTDLQKAFIIDAMPFVAAAQNANPPTGGFNEDRAIAIMGTYDKFSESELQKGQLNMAKFMTSDSTKWHEMAKWAIMSDKKTMAYTFEEMNTTDLREKVANIQIPTLVLAAYKAAPERPEFTRESVKNTFSKQYEACTKCTIHVAETDTRHFIMYDIPNWYYNELDNFLRSK